MSLLNEIQYSPIDDNQWVTVFLAGLLPGAWAGGRFAGNRHRALAIFDLLLCLLVGVFALILFIAWQELPAI